MSRRLHLVLGLAWGLLATGCEEAEPAATQPVQIQSALTLHGVPAGCQQRYDGSLGLGRAFEIADARVYLSKIELFDDLTQRWFELKLAESPSQSQGVVLLDFENGQGACAEFGSAALSTTVSGLLPPGRYSGLRFQVGLPPEHNHIDSATARGPLAEPGMFWTWQDGYKFLKFDVQAESGGRVPIRYNVHLGSTGCVAASPMSSPSAPCARPNLAQVTLQPFDPETQRLDVALEALLVPNLSATEPSPGCMGDPVHAAHCEPVMRNLGLDPSTGACVAGCQGQRVFVAGVK